MITNSVSQNEDKIEGLKDLINSIQENVNFNISMFVNILGVSIAIAGIALFILSKQWVHNLVNKEIVIIKRELKNEMVDFIKSNPQFLWARGTSIVSPATHEFYITGLSMRGGSVLLEFPTNIQILPQKGYKNFIFDARIEPNNVLVIKLNNYKPEEDGISVQWNIMWTNQNLI